MILLSNYLKVRGCLIQTNALIISRNHINEANQINSTKSYSSERTLRTKVVFKQNS